jgi:uncharacterized protein (DUF58 family)
VSAATAVNRMLPTRKLLLLLLIPAAVMLVWRTPAGIAFGIALDLSALVLVLLDLLVSPRPAHLQVDRTLSPFLSLGRDNPAGWNLRNASRFTVSFELTEDVPPRCQRDQTSVAGRILPRSRAELRYHLRPTTRGLHEFGDIYIRYRTLLGLLLRQVRLPAHHAVKVYPDVGSLGRYELALRQRRTAELGLRSTRQRGRGWQFESLREYLAGDDFADIAWKATARRGRLITRNYEAERGQNLLLVLDCGRLMTTEFHGLSRLDYAINASLLLTYVAMKQGDTIGLLAFSDRVQAYVPPMRGRGALARMNEALYRLEASPSEPDYDKACRFLALRYRKRSLIIMFTDVLDQQSSALLLAHTARFARHHLPLCVTLRNLELEALADIAPREPADCYSKIVALQLLERRSAALTRMRHTGVDVLDADPHSLTPNLISRYLQLKHSRRL